MIWFMILFILAVGLFLIQRNEYSKLHAAFLRYVIANRSTESTKLPVLHGNTPFNEDEVNPNTPVMIGRWVCCQCSGLYTLNYHRNMYILSQDKLDIQGSYRSYDCSKCGSNLMQFQLVEVLYSTLDHPWKS